MLRWLKAMLPVDQEGQGLIEYALILVLVAIVIILILTVFGDSVIELYCRIVETLDPYFNFGHPGVCN